MSDADRTVKLGDTEYTVAPQPINRVIRQLALVQQAGFNLTPDSEDEENVDIAQMIVGLGDGAYDVLKAFVPDLMAKWKFHGYASEGAYKADEYDMDSHEAMNAPTFPQLIDTFETVFEANGGTRIKDLVGKLLGPTLSNLVRRWIVAEIQTRLEGSQTSPSTNGDYPLESSTELEEIPETPPTENEDSQSLVSSAS